MNPRITTIEDRRLVGMSAELSLANYQIGALWQEFMPRRMAIKSTVSTDLFSVAIYDPHYFIQFNPVNRFTRWAAMEVAELEQLPDGMEGFTLKGGMYAVFDYKGLNTDFYIFQYIYGTWLPASEFELDDRPHFEVLGANYKANYSN